MVVTIGHAFQKPMLACALIKLHPNFWAHYIHVTNVGQQENLSFRFSLSLSKSPPHPTAAVESWGLYKAPLLSSTLHLVRSSYFALMDTGGCFYLEQFS